MIAAGGLTATALADEQSAERTDNSTYAVDDATEGFDLNAKNAWQIVSGKYEGNNPGNKTPDANGNVRIQKNVVPTDVENEFKVYLSIDKKEDINSFFEGAIFGYDNNNSKVTSPSDGYWDPVTKAGGSAEVNGRDVVLSRDDATGNKMEYWLEIGIYDSGALIYTWTSRFYLDEIPGDAKTFFIADPADAAANPNNYPGLVIGQAGNHQGTQEDPVQLKIDIDWEYYTELFGGVTQTAIELGNVTDPMGENIVFGKIEYIDGSYEYENGELTWSPEEKPNPEAVDGWYENIAELVYTISLDVTAEGFESGGLPTEYPNESLDAMYKYPTNGIDPNNDGVIDIDETRGDTQAELEYTVHTIKTGTDGPSEVTDNDYKSIFVSPIVRGLLYDITAIKVDENEQALSGAVFGLYKADGTTPIPSVTDSDKQYTATSDENGQIVFENLPHGTYVVKEITAPDGYKPSSEQWTIYVCCTGDETGSVTLKQSTENVFNAMPDVAEKTFVNERATVSATINVSKSLGGRKGEQGSVFTFTLKPVDNTMPMPTDDSGNRLESLVTQINMNNLTEGTASFPTIPIPADGEGDYQYIVTEDAGAVSGVVYSKAEYTVTVHVDGQGNLTYEYVRTKDGSGNEDATVQQQDTALFVNGPTEYSASEELTKAIVGRNWQEDDSFTFRVQYMGWYSSEDPDNLHSDSDDANVPVPEGAVAVPGSKNTWDVTFAYDPNQCQLSMESVPSMCGFYLSFSAEYPVYNEARSYAYTVSELDEGMPGMQYSKAVYALSVDVFRTTGSEYPAGFNMEILSHRVVDDEGHGLLPPDVSENALETRMIFVNTFSSVSVLPLTGGDTTTRNIILVGGGVLLLAGAAWLLARRRRV